MLNNINVTSHQSRPKFLIATTSVDLSMPLLVQAAQGQGIDVVTVSFEDSLEAVESSLMGNNFELIYIRDPFNTGTYDDAHIKAVMELITASQPQSYYVDGTKTYADLLFEDKHAQYQQLTEFMPKTEILTDTNQFIEGRHIIKKRISSRGRGVHFASEQHMYNGDYIVQPYLPIAEEYRAVVVRGRVLPEAILRRSKTPEHPIKGIKSVKIPSECSRFVSQISSKLPEFDLVGMDIMRTKDGKMYLLEANRSCQFNVYTRLTGVDVAGELVQALQERAQNIANLT